MLTCVVNSGSKSALLYCLKYYSLACYGHARLKRSQQAHLFSMYEGGHTGLKSV